MRNVTPPMLIGKDAVTAPGAAPTADKGMAMGVAAAVPITNCPAAGAIVAPDPSPNTKHPAKLASVAN